MPNTEETHAKAEDAPLRKGKRHVPSFKPVIALARGLEILRVVNEEGQATVRGIHRETGLDKATIVRMLETLEHEGYVMRDPDQAIYTPTGRTLLLSQGYDHHLWVGSVAAPILGEFRARMGWPSDVAVNDGDAMVVVQTTRGQQGPLSFNRKTGFRASVLMTSLGRAYLAYCGEEERRAIIAQLAEKPGAFNDLARQPRKLQALLDEVRQNGYAVMDDAYGEREYGGMVWAFGVPVKTEDKVYASMNMMVLKNAVSAEEAREKLLVPLQEVAHRLAEALSHKTSSAGRGD